VITFYNSLRPWVNVPFGLLKYQDVTGTGAKQYAPMQEIMCYPVGKVQQIEDYKGNTTVSHTQLYLPGEVDIAVEDRVKFEGREANIKNITNFYRAGKIDCRVVYL
jgi:hypothetical protein